VRISDHATGDARSLHRRTVLGGLGAALATSAAGCLGIESGQQVSATLPLARLDLEPIDDRDIAARIYTSVSPDQERARVLEEIQMNDSATLETRTPTLEDGERVVYGNKVYELSREVVAEQPVTIFPIVLDDLSYDSVTTDSGDTAIAFADLPAVDREIFRENGLAEGDLMGIGTSLAYTPEQVEQSVLVPDPKYTLIEWGPETRGRFGIRGEPYEDVRTTYRYTADVVSESAATYGRGLRTRYGFELADLPDEEAAILETAIAESEYTVAPETTPSAAFRSLAERFRPQQDVSRLDESGEDGDDGTEWRGSYVVEYDGEVYWAAVHVRYSEATTTSE
jgi:hypothetical protein